MKKFAIKTAMDNKSKEVSTKMKHFKKFIFHTNNFPRFHDRLTFCHFLKQNVNSYKGVTQDKDKATPYSFRL